MHSLALYTYFSLTMLSVIRGLPTNSILWTSGSSSLAFTNVSNTLGSTTTTSTTRRVEENTDWVVNSGILALGISPIKMNPVCFTGDCRSDGFGIDIFKFSYTKQPVGTCTTKLIPEHVTLTCIEASDVTAKTEKISNYNELKESYSQSSSTSAGLLSFQYGKSEQTTRMLDNIYIYGYTLFYTYAIRSVYKLTSNIASLELSDEFRTAIANMPCCSNANLTEAYINTEIFPVFGYAYMSEIELGGIAQVLTTIETTQITKWEQEGYRTSDQIGISFIVSFGKQDSEEYNKETYSDYKHYVKDIHASTMGGQPFDAINEDNSSCSSSSKLYEWMQSVSQNPAITKFNTLPIQNLLTQQRFNSDPNIDYKARAISSALAKFTSEDTARCFQDCNGNGKCQSPIAGSVAEQFNQGTCLCSSGFSGPACATTNITTASTTPIA